MKIRISHFQPGCCYEVKINSFNNFICHISYYLSYLAEVMLQANNLLLFLLPLFLYLFPVFCGCWYCCLQTVHIEINLLIIIITTYKTRQVLFNISYLCTCSILAAFSTSSSFTLICRLDHGEREKINNDSWHQD